MYIFCLILPYDGVIKSFALIWSKIIEKYSITFIYFAIFPNRFDRTPVISKSIGVIFIYMVIYFFCSPDDLILYM